MVAASQRRAAAESLLTALSALLLTSCLIVPVRNQALAPSEADPGAWEATLRHEDQLSGRKGRPAMSRPDGLFGDDPVRAEFLPELDRYLVVLQGSSQLMLLDSELQLIDSADAPRGASSLALLNDGRSALVGGTLSDTLRLFSLSGQGLLKEADYQIPGLTSTADLAVDGGELFLTDAFERGILHTPVPASSAEPAFRAPLVLTAFTPGTNPGNAQLAGSDVAGGRSDSASTAGSRPSGFGVTANPSRSRVRSGDSTWSRRVKGMWSGSQPPESKIIHWCVMAPVLVS